MKAVVEHLNEGAIYVKFSNKWDGFPVYLTEPAEVTALVDYDSDGSVRGLEILSPEIPEPQEGT